jgi:DNA-binding MarR family transcriptional regulator
MARLFDVEKAPGHLIRRAQQIVVSLFLEHTGGQLTPIQFGLLAALAADEGLDQVSLAQRMALDPSTTGSALERMEAKGWIERRADPQDKRRRVLFLTRSGKTMYEARCDDAEAVQHHLLDPLDPKERVVFMRLLTKLVVLNNEKSRAPARARSA